MPEDPQKKAIEGVASAFSASVPGGLTPDQQAAYAKVQAAFPSSQPQTGVIKGTDLVQPGSFNFPTVPTDSNNYSGMIAGGTALSDFYKNISPDAGKPTDLASLYNSLYGQSGIDTAQSTSLESKKKLDLLNAQMASLSAEAQAVPIQIQKESEGRGVTAAGVAPIETGRLRDIALRSLPLQGQILAQQAITNNDQQALEFAKDKFSMAFGIQTKQAEMDYNYKKDLRDKAWDFFTDAQKTQATKQQREDDKAFQLLQNNLNYAQSLAGRAIESGQADIAAKITQLDPKSPTYQQDLAALAGKIIEKPQIITDKNVQVIGSSEGGYLQYDPVSKTWKPISGTGGGQSASDADTYTELLQQAIDSGLSPTSSALDVTQYLESIGVQVNQKLITELTQKAGTLKKTVVEEIKPQETIEYGKGGFATVPFTDRVAQLRSMRFTEPEINNQLARDGYTSRVGVSGKVIETVNSVKSFFSSLFGG